MKKEQFEPYLVLLGYIKKAPNLFADKIMSSGYLISFLKSFF